VLVAVRMLEMPGRRPDLAAISREVLEMTGLVAGCPFGRSFWVNFAAHCTMHFNVRLPPICAIEVT
jgi:hypothetical protein